jgi:hypothetical protein
MQHLEVSGAVRPLKWPLGAKWLIYHCLFVVFDCTYMYIIYTLRCNNIVKANSFWGVKKLCEISCFCSGAEEDSSLLICYTIWMGKRLGTL